MKRIKLKTKKPNPLFELWLEEWRKQAASKNSDLQYNLSKALASLRKYPLPLKSGKDCIILQHFGKKLCLMLDKQLEKHKSLNEGLDDADDFVCINCNDKKEHVSNGRHKSNKSIESLNEEDINEQIIEQCYEDNCNSLSKFSQIHNSQSAEPDECFLKQKPKENDINIKKLGENLNKVGSIDECILNIAEDNETDLINNFQKDIYLKSNKFDIILLVDTQEISGGKTKPQHDATIQELSRLDIPFEIRHLKVGDFAWIARCRVTNNELILPYIVERKRIDDLSASITDGRFHEQKFRLKQSGIDNLLYIIEEYDKGQRLTIPHSSLIQASVNTLIQDGFSVKYTKNHKNSMFYLSSLTKILNDVFKEKNLVGSKKENLVQTNILSNTLNLMEFKEFNKAASKQKVFNVSQMFIRHLLQLKGISIDKAFAIVEHYPTPQILFNALQKSDCNRDSLLSNIEFGDKKRLLGTAISKTIYQLYTMKNLN
ncbi:mus81 structure-specific endonuclease subunit [Colletes latitarsis]|uniref:mus81 structure-specific endonuclease subunit n=1 Tax=Colletes latitarsis TaxID=2605962 RepID=UPI004036156A